MFYGPFCIFVEFPYLCSTILHIFEAPSDLITGGLEGGRNVLHSPHKALSVHCAARFVSDLNLRTSDAQEKFLLNNWGWGPASSPARQGLGRSIVVRFAFPGGFLVLLVSLFWGHLNVVSPPHFFAVANNEKFGRKSKTSGSQSHKVHIFLDVLGEQFVLEVGMLSVGIGEMDPPTKPQGYQKEWTQDCICGPRLLQNGFFCPLFLETGHCCLE